VSGLSFHPSGGIVDRALALLAAGPRSTEELAAAVMGVRGNPRAAATAVFALLGTDPRVAVDAAGVWSHAGAPPALPHPASLSEEEWVVVDVETTGGSPLQGHRVTEVAAVRVAGGEVRETFSSLVNPERRIPSMITALTGITDEMVRGAPRFHEVAPRLCDALGGRVFVAHNAAFDWRFLTAEMERTGQRFEGRQLCTVRLARKLFPNLPSRSLGPLADYFGLEIESRHRALDDAVATARVLLHFLRLLEDQGVDDWPALEALLRKRMPRRKRSAGPRSMDSA
jgi:DNA polymerase-3 subunit epsilon